MKLSPFPSFALSLSHTHPLSLSLSLSILRTLRAREREREESERKDREERERERSFPYIAQKKENYGETQPKPLNAIFSYIGHNSSEKDVFFTTLGKNRVRSLVFLLHNPQPYLQPQSTTRLHKIFLAN
jgi:hypothetical protein